MIINGFRKLRDLHEFENRTVKNKREGKIKQKVNEKPNQKRKIKINSQKKTGTGKHWKRKKMIKTFPKPQNLEIQKCLRI